MEFRILGPLQVLHDGRAVRITGPRERALLAALLLRPGAVTSADRLIDLLWGDDAPGNPPNALQAVVTRLRRALGPHGRDLLVTRTPGYALAVGHGQVDAARFEGLLAQASGLLQHDPATASDLLGQALGLWRGPALQDLADHDLIQHEIARLEELRLAALEARIQAELALGRHSEVLGELQPLAATHPLREHLQGQLMVALYRAGRQADALDVYQQTRTVLGEELGVDPEPALQALHQQILRQDPSLTAPVRSSRGRGQTLPARISSFIGRAAELDDLRRLLSRSRLVTVIGPGGSGKTSLAVEVARAAAGSQEGKGTAVSVYFVDLAPVSDPTHVPAAMAAALGLRGGPGGGAGHPHPTRGPAGGLRARHPAPAAAGQLRAPARGGRPPHRPAPTHGGRCPCPGHQPRAPGADRRGRLVHPRAGHARSIQASRPAGHLRRRPAVHRAVHRRPARVLPGRADRPAGRRDLPSARRPPAGHRAGRRQDPHPPGPGDRQTPGRPLPPPDRRGTHGSSAPANPPGGDRLELRAAHRARTVAAWPALDLRRQLGPGGRRSRLQRPPDPA